MERVLSAFGIVVLIGMAWLLSSDRRRFPLRVVLWGVGLQLLLCLLVLGVPALEISGPLLFLFQGAIDCTLEGTRFLFGDLSDGKKSGFMMAIQVLPTIVFIGALMSVLYHLRIMPMIIKAIATIMHRTMKTSGAETLASAANIFVGQTEAPLIIKPFLPKLTRSELLCVMIGGMATTAGGVLAAYVGLLRERMPDIAGHLITSSVLSAPAALLISKVMLPEKAVPQTLGKLPKDATKRVHTNIIDAAAAGASEGLMLALNVGAMLLAFIALITLLNTALLHVSGWFGLSLSLQQILGWLFAPLAWLIGIPFHEIQLAGELLGEKTIMNEFVAFVHLAEIGHQMSDRTFILLTYALSGFANFASIGIQIGGMAPLAPDRRGDLAQLGIKAVLGGTLATLMTACVVGIFL